MKTTARFTSFALCVLLAAALLCACGAASVKNNSSAYADRDPSGGEAVVDKLADLSTPEDRKLIRNVSITAETENFDGFSQAFETAVFACGGYIQSENVSTNGRDGRRSANITVRIPADKLDGFVGDVSAAASVISHSSSAEDITDSYIDTESRIRALETEQVALLALLQKAESVEEIITVQGRLSEVRGELESYKSRLEQYDNRVAYSTVSLIIREVESENADGEGFFAQAWSILKDSFRGLGQLLTGFVFLLIGALPYLLVLGIIAAIIVLSVKARRKSKLKKYRELQEKYQTAQQGDGKSE